MTAQTEALRLPAVRSDAQLLPPHHPITFEVRRLSVSFHGQINLNEVATAIPDRQVLAVIGPSGVGKATLLRVLNRTLELIPSNRARLHKFLPPPKTLGCVTSSPERLASQQ